MFCRAAERYLRLKLLPTLKTIAPDYVVARKPLKELESLNLGQYKRLIEKRVSNWHFLFKSKMLN